MSMDEIKSLEERLDDVVDLITSMRIGFYRTMALACLGIVITVASASFGLGIYISNRDGRISSLEQGMRDFKEEVRATMRRIHD